MSKTHLDSFGPSVPACDVKILHLSAFSPAKIEISNQYSPAQNLSHQLYFNICTTNTDLCSGIIVELNEKKHTSIDEATSENPILSEFGFSSQRPFFILVTCPCHGWAHCCPRK